MFKKLASLILALSILALSCPYVHAVDDDPNAQGDAEQQTAEAVQSEHQEDVLPAESSATPVVGVFNYSQVAPASDDTYYLGTCTYDNLDYIVFRYYGDWYAIFALDLSYPCYKGATALTITQTISRTYSSQSAYEFSTATGGTASAEVFEYTKTITNSVSYTTSKSFQISNSVSYEIAKDDSVGYYKIGVCHNIYRHSVEICYGPYVLNEFDMPTPNGVAYYALLYSTASDSGYRRY